MFSEADKAVLASMEEMMDSCKERVLHELISHLADVQMAHRAELDRKSAENHTLQEEVTTLRARLEREREWSRTRISELESQLQLAQSASKKS
jgi:hypothetical protein